MFIKRVDVSHIFLILIPVAKQLFINLCNSRVYKLSLSYSIATFFDFFIPGS